MNARDRRRDATWTFGTPSGHGVALRWSIAIAGLLGGLAATGCSDSAPHGPPVLQQVYWETRGSAPILIWSSIPVDGPLPTVVPPAATQFDLVFDRVIDGSKVEDTVTVNGVSHQQPKTTMVPVSVSWPDMGAQGAPAFNLAVWYNSIHLPIAPANTSYIYGRETPSYPSNTMVSIMLDETLITSKYGEAMAPVPPITIATEPFSVAINPAPGSTTAPAADAGTPSPTYVPTNFWVPLQFNNIPVDLVARLPQFVEVRQNGVLLTAGQYRLQASASDPTLILLQPGSIQIWDSGAQLDVTLAAELPDVFGSMLGTPATASFIPCQVVAGDAGARTCAPPSHGAGTDGGATDAGGGDASDAGTDGTDGPDDVAMDAG